MNNNNNNNNSSLLDVLTQCQPYQTIFTQLKIPFSFRIELNLDRRLNTLMQLVDELFQLSPESIQNSILKKPPTPNTQRRLMKSKCQETTTSSIHDMDQIANVVGKLIAATEDIRQFQKCIGDDRDRRRNNMRRAISIENGVSDNERPPTNRLPRSSAQNGSLYRKSISVDQSLIVQNQKIWKNPNDSNSSIQSIDSELQYGGGNYGRDSSMDSRLSGGSTQSDFPRGTRKKKRGIMGKLKNLTRSSKVNDSDGSVCIYKKSTLSIRKHCKFYV